MKNYIVTQEEFDLLVNTIAELPGKLSFHPLTVLQRIANRTTEAPVASIEPSHNGTSEQSVSIS